MCVVPARRRRRGAGEPSRLRRRRRGRRRRSGSRGPCRGTRRRRASGRRRRPRARSSTRARPASRTRAGRPPGRCRAGGSAAPCPGSVRRRPRRRRLREARRRRSRRRRLVQAAGENLLHGMRSGSSSPVATRRTVHVRQSEPASLIAHATRLAAVAHLDRRQRRGRRSALRPFGSSSTLPSASGPSAVHSTSWSCRPVLRSWNQRSPRRHGAPARGKSQSSARRRGSRRDPGTRRARDRSGRSAPRSMSRVAGASLSSSGRYGSAIR